MISPSVLCFLLPSLSFSLDSPIFSCLPLLPLFSPSSRALPPPRPSSPHPLCPPPPPPPPPNSPPLPPLLLSFLIILLTLILFPTLFSPLLSTPSPPPLLLLHLLFSSSSHLSSFLSHQCIPLLPSLLFVSYLTLHLNTLYGMM
jgi:hypothetical protein